MMDKWELVYDVAPAEGFDGYEWDYRKLPERLQNCASAQPQTITLDALMATAGQSTQEQVHV